MALDLQAVERIKTTAVIRTISAFAAGSMRMNAGIRSACVSTQMEGNRPKWKEVEQGVFRGEEARGKGKDKGEALPGLGEQ
jgi:hypothetical protein